MHALIDQLVHDGYLKTPAIIAAFREIPREAFVREQERDEANVNFPLPIGYGQTVSQPLTVAFMLELLQPQPGESVLDVGAGSGWTTALFAHLVGPTGSVTAIERIPQLHHFAEKNLAPFRFPNVTVLAGDGTRGFDERAPFSIIHVAAASSDVPKALKRQLAMNGRLIIPIGEGVQAMTLLRKYGPNDFTVKTFPGFSFVPLIDHHA